MKNGVIATRTIYFSRLCRWNKFPITDLRNDTATNTKPSPDNFDFFGGETMTFLVSLFVTKVLGFFLMFADDKSVSFGLYEIKRSLTPLGWALIIILPLALIFGIIYLAAKVIKKRKLK